MKSGARLTAVVLLGLMIGSATVVLAGPPRPATDAQVKEMIASAGDAKDYDDAPILCVLDEADVFVQDSGLATTESCELVKVLTDKGTRSQSALRLEFDPDTYRVTIKSVRIHRKDGGIEDVPLDPVLTQPAPQHMIYWGNQQYVLSLPRLDVGDVLEKRISKIGFNIAYLADGPTGGGGAGGEETLQPPMPGHWHETARFQTSCPIVKKRYSVHMPKDKPLQYEVYNGELKMSLWFDGDAHVHTFEAEDIPALKKEPRMVDADDHITKVVLATVPDWETKSRWFHEVNEPQFDSDDAIRAKVEELTTGLKDDDAKVAALNHWVADNIRYCGTSRGPREGFTLHTGIETFHDREGVCKDKAGMLITMLRAAGFEAYPALTMAGSRVEAIPADQFNHTVSVMREKDGSFRILDPTWIPLSRSMWSPWEALQGLVYGTPEGQSLTLSPYYPPEFNQVIGRSEGEILADGTLSARITLETKGRSCTYLRRKIFRQSKPVQRAALEEVLNIGPSARLEEIDFTDPFDYSRDSQVNMRVSAPGFAAVGESVGMFRLPLMSRPLGKFFFPDLFYEVDADERKFGVRMQSTRLVRYEETLKLPAGWKVAHAPEKQTMDSESASLSFEVEPGEGVLTYRFEFTLKKNVVPPEDYADFKKAMEAMGKLADEWVVCTAG